MRVKERERKERRIACMLFKYGVLMIPKHPKTFIDRENVDFDCYASSCYFFFILVVAAVALR